MSLKRIWMQSLQGTCRFYFISDDELLSVLGTSDPTAIQEHMLKLFDNAAALVFDHGCKAVTGMVSSEVPPIYLIGLCLQGSGSGVNLIHVSMQILSYSRCFRHIWY